MLSRSIPICEDADTGSIGIVGKASEARYCFGQNRCNSAASTHWGLPRSYRKTRRLYCGVHNAPSDNCRLPRYISTDSQTSIFSTSKAIHRPEALRTHEHKPLLHRIAQTLVAQDLPVHILTVRAHTGVQGNELVDGLATDAHENPTTGTFCTAGRAGWGLHWVRYLYA